MLWVVGPLAAASSVATALVVGCAKGRDDKKIAKTQRSSGKSRRDATRSGKSTRSGAVSGRAGDKSSRSGKSARAGDKSGRRSGSARAGDKSGRRSGSTRPGDKSSRSGKSTRAGDKSGKSGRSSGSSKSGAKKHPTGKPPKHPGAPTAVAARKDGKIGSKESVSQKSSSEKKKALVAGAAGGAAVAGGKATAKPSGSQREKRSVDGSSKRSSRSGRSKGKSSRSKRDAKAGAAGAAAGAAAKDKSGRSSRKSSRSGRKSSRSSRSKRASSKDKKAAVPIAANSSTRTAVVVDKAAAGAASAAIASGPAPKIASAPRLDMRVEPAELRYNPAGGIQKVTIANTSDKRKAIKVKCSDNLLYRVNPVHAFVEPGGVARVDVLRQNGAAKVDKIVVVAAETTKDAQCAKTACASATNTDMLILPLIAATAE